MSESCSCCGGRTRTVWGSVNAGALTVASYIVQWNARHLETPPEVGVIVGKGGVRPRTWGDCVVALLYRVDPNGLASFIVIDAADRPAAKVWSDLPALRRKDVIGKPVAGQVFTIVDTILDFDDRLAEIKHPGVGMED